MSMNLILALLGTASAASAPGGATNPAAPAANAPASIEFKIRVGDLITDTLAQKALVAEAHAAPVPNAKPSSDRPNLAALSDKELGGLRGGQSIVVGNQTLTAITSGNVIDGDYISGAVSLSDYALSNFNGVGNLLINTGGQVSLQSGMNLIINVGE